MKGFCTLYILIVIPCRWYQVWKHYEKAATVWIKCTTFCAQIIALSWWWWWDGDDDDDDGDDDGGGSATIVFKECTKFALKLLPWGGDLLE